MAKLIYALCDPRDNRVKYVGYTKDFTRRLHYHYRGLRGGKRDYGQHIRVWEWLDELAQDALLPIGKLLQRIDDTDDWESAEKYWIAHFKSLGEPLLNNTDGGMGTQDGNWKRVTDERKEVWRKRISEGAKRSWKNRSPEHREAALNVLSEGRKMRHPELDGPHTEEQKRKIGESSKKQWDKWRAQRGLEGTWSTRRLKSGGHKAAWDNMDAEKKKVLLDNLAKGRRKYLDSCDGENN